MKYTIEIKKVALIEGQLSFTNEELGIYDRFDSSQLLAKKVEYRKLATESGIELEFKTVWGVQEMKKELETKKELLEEIIHNRQAKGENADDFISEWWRVIQELESK